MEKDAIWALAAGAALAWGTLAAAELDLTDFNDDVMKTMDDSAKSLNSDLSDRNASSAAADAAAIVSGMKLAEEYFVRKGTVPDAVKWAKQAQDLATQVARSVAANDFTTALDSYDTLQKTCHTCHNVYKPPEL